ncbi:MAG: ABC transporter substrate-binding protein [Raineya sp.]|nr:ABC transporter substrate-binding protein [Raineya sp.]
MLFRKATYFTLIILLTFSCKVQEKQTSTQTQNLQKVFPKYAKGFFWEKGESFTILYITRSFNDKTDTLKYVLASQKQVIPQNLQQLSFIQVPLKRLVSTSTTHIPALEVLESLDCLVASNSLQYAYSEAVQQRAKEGKITALNEETLEYEKILALQANLLMVSAMPATKMNLYQKIQQAKIPVLPNAEWLEEHPLGKAEWIKLFGLLLQKEKEAEEFFAKVEKDYNELKKLAQKVAKPKKVAVGVPQKEIWYVPAGKSFGAVFLKDANLDYAFAADTGKGSLQLSRELVFSKFADAEIWLNAEIPPQLDSKEFCKYAQIQAVKQNAIYDRQKRLSKAGGNDYWERAVLHPEEVLGDLIQIAYPKLLPQRELVYYRKIEIVCP